MLGCSYQTSSWLYLRREAKRLVSAPTRRSAYVRFVLPLPRSSQQIRRAGGPSRHASRPPASKILGFTRNHTRPTTRNTPFPLPETHTRSFGERCSGPVMCGEKEEKSDPWGVIHRFGEIVLA